MASPSKEANAVGWLIEPSERDRSNASIGVTEGARPSAEIRDALERLTQRLHKEDKQDAPIRTVRGPCAKEKVSKNIRPKE